MGEIQKRHRAGNEPRVSAKYREPFSVRSALGRGRKLMGRISEKSGWQNRRKIVKYTQMKIIKRLAKKTAKPFFSVWTAVFLLLQITAGAFLPAPSFFPENLQTKTAKAAWLSGYDYRKQITVTGQSGAGTNYQVLLKVGETSGASGENFDLNNHAQNFPNDIRFTDNDETTQLDHWLEQTTGTTPNRVAEFWVEVADNLDTNQNIYIYYGKSGDSSASNYANTFAVLGTGLDGALDLSPGSPTTYNLNTTTNWPGSPSIAPGVNFSVTENRAANTNQIVITTAATGLSVGDEIFIINLQGTSGDYSNVGKYEFARISSMAGSGPTTLTLDRYLKNSYNGTTR